MPKEKVLRLVTAFTLSGILHALGSFTTLSPTKPFSNFLSYERLCLFRFSVQRDRAFRFYTTTKADSFGVLSSKQHHSDF